MSILKIDMSHLLKVETKPKNVFPCERIGVHLSTKILTAKSENKICEPHMPTAVVIRIKISATFLGSYFVTARLINKVM